MIDNIHFYFNVQNVQMFSQPYFTQTAPDVYTFKLFEHGNGLRVKYNPEMHTCSIQNSFTKLFHGNNIVNLTHSELQTICTTLPDVFNTHPESMKITKMEYGTNISTPQPAAHYIKEFTELSAKAFCKSEPPKGFTKHLQTKCYGSERALKIYDKGTFERLKITNFLRVECVYTTARCIGKVIKAPPNIATLPDVFHLNQHKNYLTNLLRQSKRTPAVLPPDVLKELTPPQIFMLFASPDVWVNIKNKSYGTYKAMRKQYNQLYRQILPVLQHTDIAPIVEAKINELLQH
ncbi:hypothetical protein C7N43_00975 [Sphingobacteriales bacterium UPWRP_1]|nr:hypothetical protein B6N25_14355 [Sphingobacteriales bacterium TSM_CSS]PSJ78892.1 hypothetical protein C7N43_00975 [Sphingobacteriales bacterium UPWRP_1]